MNAIGNLAGYQITEQLYAGQRTLVYRAIRTIDRQPVAIKVLRNEYPNFNELLQFRNQYTIAKNLDFPSIIKPLSLEVYHNGYALIMEDFGGISLARYLQPSKVGKSPYKYLPLLEFLEIAIKITETLHYIYQNRVIHKDIKPANILINPETKQVKLIDFSIASILPRETQEIQNANALEGTLAYLSPEQTGRMNRGIDYRSDFYSLGVTFYELLTGVLPFVSEDAMELVHCHLAKQPITIDRINPEIPLVLSKIVSKLMAKNAEERYQSAWGIKHDLEICSTQLRETGKIENFEIARRDICDRFIIPEKLYGRESEINQLLDAFERVSTGNAEMMLVAGYSGIGKTAVVNEVHKPIARQRGYFIKGKYDQFNRHIPLSAFVQAFRDLMAQLLSESEAQTQTWRTKILEALGENGQVLIDVIPELENIIGKQPAALELSGNAAQNRFNILFQKFVQVFTNQEHPLVMFLDDLQWADSASLNLLKLLMEESGYLLILGAYRDNEVSAVHPFILTVDELVKTGVNVHTITLPPLKESDMNSLVADTLNCELFLAQPLTKLVYQKTKGNPFFATQFLKALHDDKLIVFNYPDFHLDRGKHQGGWQCDIAQIKSLSLTDDVVEFMALQLQKLPLETQEIIKLAACVGATFDLNTLAIVSEKSPESTAAALWKILQEGLVIPTTKIYKFFTQSDSDRIFEASVNSTYRFLHDRIQQASYSLIPENQKQQTHYQIGQLLQQNLSEIERQEKLFDIVGHLNLAIELIAQPDEREDLARLNLAAGQKAKNSTAYSAARNFVQTGLSLLSVNCWQSQYELTLNLYVAAAETAYLNADFAEMEQKAGEVLQSAQTVLDKVKIYQIQISALAAQSRLLDAIAVGRIALAQLGIELPVEPDRASVDRALEALTERIPDRQIAELTNLPEMSDRQTIAAMQLLAMLFLPIFIGNFALLPVLTSSMVNLSLEFGNAPASIIGYASYGMLLCASFGEVERGYAFSRLALSLLDRLDGREFKSLTLLLCSFLIHHRQEALRSTIPMMKEGYLAGMETGDFFSAGHNADNYLDSSLFAGVCLDDWELEVENYCTILSQIKQDSSLVFVKMKQQMVQNLRSVNQEPDVLKGTAYDETVMIPQHHQNSELSALAALYIGKLMLAYFFDNYNNALDYIAQAKLFLATIAGATYAAIFHFYAGLTDLALCSTQSEIEQANIFERVKIHQDLLSEWTRYAPMNHQHRVDLLAAEKCRILGQKAEAIELYEQAILGAKENQYTHEEGLANELAAKFYLSWGKEKVAVGYMQEAYYCYTRWGAKTKIAYLEEKYPQLLGTILQPTNLAIAPGGTISSSIGRSISNTGQTSNTNLWLDFPAVTKAAQAISEEIALEKLLATLMEIAIANGGAQTGILVIHQEAKLVVAAKGDRTDTEMLLIPLAEYQELPQSLIYSVARNQTTAVFDDLSDSPQFISDPYTIAHQPKSALCTPISKQGKLVAILYLENNLTVGAFTRDRVESLQIIASQAAISIENARLYQKVEKYSQNLAAEVERQTQALSQKAFDLEQTLKNLQQTQAQLIQSEKMSALGQLVAGIAHEINNPVTFIHGNLEHTENYIKDLLSLLEVYQQEYPETNPAIQAKIEQIDLGFIWKDLTNVLQSMKSGSERIKQIILSLRNFSRLDEADMKAVDIHAGIDSTLLILQNRLQENNDRPKVEIIKEYGNLPSVTCYASQLNQVFLSIISNAIDAFQSMDEIGGNPQIRIKTELLEKERVSITISDNGSGITAAIKQRIFEPFFTTKPVGSGTGLGLSVSYAIIKQHGGQLICNSTVKEGTAMVIEIPLAPSEKLIPTSQFDGKKN
ncbi:MAG TPA: AAA family ATPase [Leptolyngbyaceae cyanobacterium]